MHAACWLSACCLDWLLLAAGSLHRLQLQAAGGQWL
jgi:hypothetical protein